MSGDYADLRYIAERLDTELGASLRALLAGAAS